MHAGGIRTRLLLCLFSGYVGTAVAVPDDVTFPPPIRSGGMGIFTALQARREVSRYDARLLHWEVLGNILWAACGINRANETSRTIPVATPSFALQIYLLAEEGVWKYDELGHRLIGIKRRDLREMAITSRADDATQPFAVQLVGEDAPAAEAPVLLLLAATEPFAGFGLAAESAGQGMHLVLAAIQAGHAAQNVQLVAVSEGLGAQVLLPPQDAEALAQHLGISSPDHILLILRLGYPAAP